MRRVPATPSLTGFVATTEPEPSYDPYGLLPIQLEIERRGFERATGGTQYSRVALTTWKKWLHRSSGVFPGMVVYSVFPGMVVYIVEYHHPENFWTLQELNSRIVGIPQVSLREATGEQLLMALNLLGL